MRPLPIARSKIELAVIETLVISLACHSNFRLLPLISLFISLSKHHLISCSLFSSSLQPRVILTTLLREFFASSLAVLHLTSGQRFVAGQPCDTISHGIRR